jgi:hypothetical protein
MNGMKETMKDSYSISPDELEKSKSLLRNFIHHQKMVMTPINYHWTKNFSEIREVNRKNTFKNSSEIGKTSSINNIDNFLKHYNQPSYNQGKDTLGDHRPDMNRNQTSH